MSMSIAEARSEIKTRFEAARDIQTKYPDLLITNGEDKAQVDKLLGEVSELEGKLLALEDAEQKAARVQAGVRQYNTPAELHHQPQGDRETDEFASKSIGQIFTDDAEYQRLLKTGVFDSPTAIANFAVSLGQKTSLYKRVMGGRQSKALMYSDAAVGGGFVTPDYRPGLVDILQRPLSLLDIIPTAQTTSDTISYVREDTFTNAAAMVAEASATTGTSGTKPESAIAFSRQTSPVRTAATWIPVTNRMLADAPAIRGVIDQRLMVMLEQTLETQILTGNGAGDNFTGILAAGIQTRGLSTDSAADALYKAAVQVAVTGEIQPDTIVLNPLNWQTIRLARESASTATPGSYLMGPPSVVGADTLWGYRVVLSQAMTSGTGLVGSFRMGGMYFEREGASIRSGLIDDQFVRNMQTLLVESRGAFITFRPTAFCRVTGLS